MELVMSDSGITAEENKPAIKFLWDYGHFEYPPVQKGQD